MQIVTVGVAPDLPALVPFQYALDVAAGSRSSLQAVLVNDSVGRCAPAFVQGDVLAESLKRVRDAWDEKVAGVERRLADQARKRHVKLEIVRREGRVADEILDAAVDSGLIVVGRGRGSAVHAGSLGSRVELVVRRCSNPLLMTPLEYREPRRVVAAYAGKPLGGRVLDLAAGLARTLETGLIVLTAGEDREWIGDVQRRAREHLASQSSGLGEVEYVGLVGRPQAVIPERVGRDDVLVIGPHGRSPIYRMLLGRVTDHVIRAVGGPLVLAAKD